MATYKITREELKRWKKEKFKFPKPITVKNLLPMRPVLISVLQECK